MAGAYSTNYNCHANGMNEAAFDTDRLQILWQTWSIYLAGALLILIYFSALRFGPPVLHRSRSTAL
jgi:hypothetical protein